MVVAAVVGRAVVSRPLRSDWLKRPVAPSKRDGEPDASIEDILAFYSESERLNIRATIKRDLYEITLLGRNGAIR